MPIVVNEIVFKGEIRSGRTEVQTQAAPATRSESEIRAIVEAAVEEILLILEGKEER